MQKSSPSVQPFSKTYGWAERPRYLPLPVQMVELSFPRKVSESLLAQGLIQDNRHGIREVQGTNVSPHGNADAIFLNTSEYTVCAFVVAKYIFSLASGQRSKNSP